jgi:hypothetical protein
MGLDPNTSIIIGLAVWSAIFPLIILVQRGFNIRSTGLPLAYLGIFFAGHAPGAVLYLLPWYFTSYDGFAVSTGFEMTWLSVVIFTIALLVGMFLFHRRTPSEPHTSDSHEFLNDPRLPWLLFGIGLFAFFVLLPLGGLVASLTSIVSNLANLQVAGIVLGIWQGFTTKNSRKILMWLAVTPLLPFLTVTVGGFLGFGINSLLTIAAFTLIRTRPRWWHLPLVMVALYIGISLYVTYIDGRADIRAVVWNEGEYSERVEVVRSEFSQWQWFDWRNGNHLQLIDVRLNQNFFVGVSRLNLDRGLVPFANGESLQRAAIGFIPRIIWPEKPVMAGGNEFMARYTLMEFAEGTSFAAGQVMEFYINYGMWGIVVGFSALGLVFAWVDSRSAGHLENGNLYRFLRWYLVGMALLKPIDDLTHTTAGAAGAFVTAVLLEIGLKWWYQNFGNREKPPVAPVLPFPVSPRR